MFTFLTWRVRPGFFGRHLLLKGFLVVLVTVLTILIAFHLDSSPTSPGQAAENQVLHHGLDVTPAVGAGLPAVCYRTVIPFSGSIYNAFEESCPQAQTDRQNFYNNDVAVLRSHDPGTQALGYGGEDLDAFPWCISGPTCAVPGDVQTVAGYPGPLPRRASPGN